MKPQIIICALLAGILFGCQKQKTTIFMDTAWNRDYAKNACEAYRKNHSIGCIKTPEQIATESSLRFSSSVLQSSACKDVTISYALLGEGNLKEYERGWSLSFNIGIDDGDIDYSGSDWQIIDNKTNKRFSEGSLKDPVGAATGICIVAAGQGGSVQP
jgi:hypothetical protein